MHSPLSSPSSMLFAHSLFVLSFSWQESPVFATMMNKSTTSVCTMSFVAVFRASLQTLNKALDVYKSFLLPGICHLSIHQLHKHQRFKMCIRTIVSHMCNVCGDIYSTYPHPDLDPCRDVRRGRRCRSGVSTEPLDMYSGLCGRCIIDEENERRRDRGIPRYRTRFY